MTTLLRRFVDLLTFGLVRRLDAEVEAQEKNVKRVAAGKPRIIYTPTGNMLADRYRGVRDEPRA